MPVAFLSQPLQFVKGVGPRRAADLERVGLRTVEDLLLRFPLRYEDRAGLTTIAALRPGQTATVVGDVLSSGIRPTRRPGFRLFEVVIRDPSGAVRAVFPNQSFLKDVFHPQQQVVFYGPLEYRGGGLQFTNPEYEIVRGDIDDSIVPSDDAHVHTGRIVPIYEKVGSLTTRMQRSLVHQLLGLLPEDLSDPLPPSVRKALSLPARREAILHTHFPPPGTSVDDLNRFRTEAQRRLIFEEFFLFQAGLVLRKRRHADLQKARPVLVDDRIRASARKAVPFKLTAGQKEALREIVVDMQRSAPMHRLLQGDVGAGKTIVALLAAVVAMENGFQVAFMAPTEILADQHYLTIRRLLETSRFRVASLTGSVTGARKRAVLAEIASGTTHLVVGTHALVEGAVEFKDLGLIVIDEQHRFGVMQRATLRAKGLRPDVLVMTATPIPRTLAMTAYADLDVSVIDELPPGRTPVRTVVLPETRRDEVVARIHGACALGRQAYWVCPLIDESELVPHQAAEETAAALAAALPELRIGLVHGRMSGPQKDTVMTAFKAARLDVLVATTVIEVGVDVPNASLMIVENAERMGLSQLHQLRGRVGRGATESTCVLLYKAPLSPLARERLGVLRDTTDGFEVARRDLELRGPGELLGTRQTGLMQMRVADLMRDSDLLPGVQQAAARMLAGPDANVAALLRRWIGDGTRFGKV